jgi:tRNA threonylcarbamoyladenosine biosynthesis protein TsaE
MNFVVESEKELGQKIYQKMRNSLRGGFKCALSGDLGAGKTTMVREIAQIMGSNDSVSSPTFTLRKEYKLPRKVNGAQIIQHIDLYRFEMPTKHDRDQVLEWLDDSQAITFVEWPEKIPEIIENFDMGILLEAEDIYKRKVTIK